MCHPGTLVGTTRKNNSNTFFGNAMVTVRSGRLTHPVNSNWDNPGDFIMGDFPKGLLWVRVGLVFPHEHR